MAEASGNTLTDILKQALKVIGATPISEMVGRCGWTKYSEASNGLRELHNSLSRHLAEREDYSDDALRELEELRAERDAIYAILPWKGVWDNQAHAVDELKKRVSVLITEREDLRHLLEAALKPPIVGGSIPAGMKPWYGGNAAPSDWDSTKPIACVEDGRVIITTYFQFDWRADPRSDFDEPLARIIAYTPKTEP